MRISDWSSDVCSSDLPLPSPRAKTRGSAERRRGAGLAFGRWNGCAFQPTPILGNQGFFLRTRPVLDFEFGGFCLFARFEALGPNEFDRSSGRSVAAQYTLVVLIDAFVQIVGVAGVIAAVQIGRANV